MARVAGHLSVEDLEAGFRSDGTDGGAALSGDLAVSAGHTIADVAAVTSFVPRWIEQLLARYNANGPDALGDLRRRNGGVPRVLRPALLECLRARLTLERADEALGAAIPLGGPHEGGRTLDAQEGKLLLEGVGHVLAPVIVPDGETARDLFGESAEAAPYALADRLERLKAGGPA